MIDRFTFSANTLLRVVLCFLSITLTLGFFNSSWLSLIIFASFFMLLYSGEVQKKNKNLLLVLVICFGSFFLKSLIFIPAINLGSNVFIGGEKYKESVFGKNLPEEVFNKLNKDFMDEFPDSVSGPDKYLYDKSVKQIFFRNNETKIVKSINWKNRYEFSLGAFNDANYNAYSKQQPERTKLPFFVKYTLPPEYNDNKSKFCWKGLAFIEKDSLSEILHKDKKCIFIKDYIEAFDDQLVIWLVETGKTPELEAELILPISYKLKLIFITIYKSFGCLIILFLSFNKIRLEKSGLFLFSFIFSSVLVFYYTPSIIYKFVLFEGGNDGLLYVHFAHLISDYLSLGNFKDAFRGGESAYDLMPFYRYIWIINYILFEESPWIFFYILTFLPLVIFSILNNLLNNKWAVFFIVCWFFLPLFEAFGFFHFYYVKLTLRGFAEPLSYLCFLSGLVLILKLIDNNLKESGKNNIPYFFIGFLLSLSMGLRANILPACFVLMTYLFYKNMIFKNYSNVFYLIFGFSPILVLPLHNYYFTKKFIPLTIAAYKDWNLGAKPFEYIQLLFSFLKFDPNYLLLNKIVSHVGDEIKFYEFWYHITILSCLFFIFKGKSLEKIKLLSYTAFSMVSLILFYHVGGRYSYLTWTLTLFVFAYCLKELILPKIYSNRKNHAN